MKLTIDRADLMRALSHVQSVVERRNTIPILSNVRLDAADGMVTLTATDMDLEMRESVAATVEVDGSTTIPAHTFHDIVRKLGDDAKVELALEPGGNMMTVTAGRSKFKLSCLPVADFPELGTGDMDVTFTLPANGLRELVDRTRFAMSNDETRYYLNGAYVHAAEANGVPVLRAVATDGHRLAQFEMPLPDGAVDMPGVIIPRKAVAEIRKLVEEAAADITIELSENKVKFAFDHIVMTSKLIDGTFPDYQKVIPQGNDKIVEVNPKLFTSAIDRVSTISNEKTRAVKLAIDGNTMTLSAQSPDSGSATEDIEISNDNTTLEIGFNSKYLLDITAQIGSDQCRMTLADSGGPTIIQDASDPSSLYVLMPFAGLIEVKDSELTKLKVKDLLSINARTLQELRNRNILRTANKPGGDLAEYIFCKTFDWEMAANSSSGYDAIDKDGFKYQIKSRQIIKNVRNERQLSAIRNLEKKEFDYIAIVLFNFDYSVYKACIAPYEYILQTNPHYAKHDNKYIFYADDKVWENINVKDVTEKVISTFNNL